MATTDIEKIIHQFIEATNAFDVEKALRLFADNAVIDDVSVGEKFEGLTGVGDYLAKFFVGYKTKTKVLSIEKTETHSAKVQVDFKGDFGHETGGLDFTFDASGLISNVDAYLD